MTSGFNGVRFGATIWLNGRETLRFHMTQDPATWKSADGKVELRFAPRRRLPQDAVGFFTLSVAPDLLEPGKPCRLGVTSRGTGRRWFGLNPYTDILGPQ